MTTAHLSRPHPTTRTPAQRVQDAINSNRLAKANKLATVLVKECGGVLGDEDVKEVDGVVRFMVARRAGVNMERRVGDWTWKFAVGVARRRIGA